MNIDLIKFERPFYLLFLIPAIILGYHILIKGNIIDGYPLSSLRKIPNKKNYIKFFKYLFFFLSALLLVLGVSTPLYPSSKIPIEEKGHAFIFCIDISSTMKALDFNPQNRLDKAKEIIETFIKIRKTDFFGIIIFAKYSIPYVPLTSDNKFVLERLKEINLDLIEDGTAIGNAIISGVNQLKGYKGQSKNIILITDGINNEGYIHPINAAKEAKKQNIFIYPIAIGTEDLVPFPFKDSRGMIYTRKIKISVDYEILLQISKITGNGENYVGKTTKDLQNIFKKIDNQRPIVTNIKTYTKYENLDKPLYFISILFFLLFLLFQFITTEVEF